jgi:hypothetical protein
LVLVLVLLLVLLVVVPVVVIILALVQVQVGESGGGFGDVKWEGVRYHLRWLGSLDSPPGAVGLTLQVQRMIRPAAAGAADLDGRGVAELAEEDTQDGDAGCHFCGGDLGCCPYYVVAAVVWAGGRLDGGLWMRSWGPGRGEGGGLREKLADPMESSLADLTKAVAPALGSRHLLATSP